MIVELFGPSGAGKSAIADCLEDIGIQREAAPRDCDDHHLIDHVNKLFSGYLGPRLSVRARGLLRSMSRLLKSTSRDWKVADGGVLHRVQGMDRMIPRVPLAEIMDQLPMPVACVYVNCPIEELKSRNKGRVATLGQAHDRSYDVERSYQCAVDTAALVPQTTQMLEVNAMAAPRDNAEKIASWLTTVSRGAEEPRQFTGDVASNYDERRADQAKWHAEQAIIETALQCVPEESVVLDVPIGTGRWFDTCRKMNHSLVGVDISKDMLAEAQKKVKDGDDVLLINGPSWKTGLKDKSVDVAVMCRLTRWLSPIERTATMLELQRVTKSLIIFTARVDNHEYAYTRDDINKTIQADWASAWDYGAAEEDYRVMAIASRSSGWFRDGKQVGLPLDVEQVGE